MGGTSSKIEKSWYFTQNMKRTAGEILDENCTIYHVSIYVMGNTKGLQKQSEYDGLY